MSFDHETGDNTYPDSRDNFEGPEVQTSSMLMLRDIMRLVNTHAYLYAQATQPWTAIAEKEREAVQAVEDAVVRLIADRDQANTIAADCKAQNERLVAEIKALKFNAECDADAH